MRVLLAAQPGLAAVGEAADGAGFDDDVFALARPAGDDGPHAASHGSRSRCSPTPPDRRKP
jgi:hypothetical protein